MILWMINSDVVSAVKRNKNEYINKQISLDIYVFFRPVLDVKIMQCIPLSYSTPNKNAEINIITTNEKKPGYGFSKNESHPRASSNPIYVFCCALE